MRSPHSFNYEDTHHHRGMRRRLIETLHKKYPFPKIILQAMSRIPRHFFLDPAFQEWAYKDVAFPIDADQTISQPFTVAMQTHLLDISPGEKVLEIGTGSGYQACVLHELGCKVYSIERQENLFHKTRKLLKKLGYQKIRLYLGDGWQGKSTYAPFDKIIVTAGAAEIPEQLIAQLKTGGLMVVPVGSQAAGQKMLRLIKNENNEPTIKEHGDFRFVPMLKGISKATK